jgi:uncharacterized protein YkwD
VKLLLFALLIIPVKTFAYEVPDITKWQNLTLQLINISRSETGLTPVRMDSYLNQISQNHAEDTAINFDNTSDETRRNTYLSHTSSNGDEFSDRIQNEKIMSAGENVGFYYQIPFSPAEESMDKAINLMHSSMMAEIPPDDGHKKTILGDYTHVGIGLELHREISSESNAIFLVTDFGKYKADALSQSSQPQLTKTNRWSERIRERQEKRRSAWRDRFEERVRRRIKNR